MTEYTDEAAEARRMADSFAHAAARYDDGHAELSKTATGATGKRMSFAFPEIPWHKPKSKKQDPDQENQPDTEPEEGESSE